MTERTNMPSDEMIADAWSDIAVTDELRASTLKAALENQQATPAGSVAPPTSERSADNKPHAAEFRVTRDGTRKRRPTQAKRRRVAVGLIAACLSLAVMGFGGNMLYFDQTAFAAVDSQSDVSLALNRFGLVVQATAQDSSRQGEIDSLSLMGKDYKTAMEVLVASGYLGSDVIDVDIASDDAAQANTLVETTTACLNGAGCNGACNGNRYGQSEGSGQGNGTGQGNGLKQRLHQSASDSDA